MFRICTAAQMKEIDRLSAEKGDVPGIILMENAAHACVDEIKKEFGNLEGKNAICVCGKGNNGGDGLAIARLLSRLGVCVSVFLTHGDDYRGDALANYKMLKNMNALIYGSCDELSAALAKADFVVDAVFGIGIYGSIDFETSGVIEQINAFDGFVLSVDIPSGLEADTGEICGICVNADVTITFAAYKPGLFMFPGCECAGRIVCADICTPEFLFADCNKYLTDEEFCRNNFPKRTSNSQKGDYGKVLIIGGSRGMTGAAAMAAESALRCGSGLVTVGICESLNNILECKLTEPMTVSLAEKDGHLSAECIGAVAELMKKADSVLFGPGIGTSEDIEKILEFVMENCTCPLIIDADGLNVLSKNTDLIQRCSCNLIFTPHEVEMSRLCAESLSEITDDRIRICEEFSEEYGVTLILKGHHTIVTAADGTQYINNTGNSGLATGGSGDVLAGMVASLAARGVREDIAAAVAVYLHGKSGDAAANELGEDSVTATDIIKYFPKTLKSVLKGKNYL